MESIENKISEVISDIRSFVEKIDNKDKTKVLNKIDYLDEKFEDMINFVYASEDNLEDLKETLEME